MRQLQQASAALMPVEQLETCSAAIRGIIAHRCSHLLSSQKVFAVSGQW